MTSTPSPRRPRGRPRGDIQLTRQVHYRITEEEYLTLETLAGAWAAKLRAQGVPLVGDNRNAWFRSMVGELRKQAEAQGITFALQQSEPSSEPSTPEPPLNPPKRRRRDGE